MFKTNVSNPFATPTSQTPRSLSPASSRRNPSSLSLAQLPQRAQIVRQETWNYSSSTDSSDVSNPFSPAGFASPMTPMTPLTPPVVPQSVSNKREPVCPTCLETQLGRTQTARGEQTITAHQPTATKDALTPNRTAEITETIKHWAKEVGQYAYVAAAQLGVPLAASAIAGPHGRNAMFWAGSGALYLTNAWLVAEAIASQRSWNRSRGLHEQPSSPDLAKRVVANVSAYLPNEIETLEESLRAMAQMELPAEGQLVILVSHNGGSEEQKQELRDIIARISCPESVRIIERDNPASTSKAHNVNGSIAFLESEPPDVVVLYDADHRPDRRALLYALETLHAQNADLVQGRCVIDRGSPLIGAEFDTIYAVNHAGGYILRGFGIFGGTNGYWKFDLLKNIGMDETMLTEDVDSGFRSLASGAKVVFDPLVRSNEEAPPTLEALWKQRLRWAQGWSQVGVRHLPILWNSNLSARNKFTAFMMLHWREIYGYASPLVMPAALFSWVHGEPFFWKTAPVLAIQFGMQPALSVLAAAHVGNAKHPNLHEWNLVKYCAIAPLYDMGKNCASTMAHFRNMFGMTKWNITRRAANTNRAANLERAPEAMRAAHPLAAEPLIPQTTGSTEAGRAEAGPSSLFRRTTPPRRPTFMRSREPVAAAGDMV